MVVNKNYNMKDIILFVIIFFLLVGCKRNNNSLSIIEEATDSLPQFQKEIVISDISMEHFKDLSSCLQVANYVPLSSEVLVGAIKEVQLVDDCIYILDGEPKITVFNLDGSLRFQIAQRGNGPEDFKNIRCFAIDEKNHQIHCYDSGSRTIRIYNSKTGKFISQKSVDINPSYMTIQEDYTLFYTPSIYSLPTDFPYRYSLLSYNAEGEVAKCFFPHDPDLSTYSVSSGESLFFKNSSEIFFVYPFANDTVYSLYKGKPYPKYKVRLPNFVNKETWKTKPNFLSILQSPRSCFLSQVYQCKDLLYFTFNYESHYIWTLYDLKKDKVLYCSYPVYPDKPTKELPIFNILNGVYKDQYYTLIPAYIFMREQEKGPHLYPSDLNINEEDNPVLVFYKIVVS